MIALLIVWLYLGLWFWVERLSLTRHIGVIPMFLFLFLSLLLGPINFVIEENP